MSDCTCPPTVGNSHLGTVDYVPVCPVHRGIAPKKDVIHQWFCGGKEPCACMDSWKAMTDAERSAYDLNKVAPKEELISAAEIRRRYIMHDLYEALGICPVCKGFHCIGVKGNCGKG